MMAKHNYKVELARLYWNTSYRSAPLEAQTYENAIYQSVWKVSVLIFYLIIYWTYLKLQVISFKVW
jgi:hypothetical protein